MLIKGRRVHYRPSGEGYNKHSKSSHVIILIWKFYKTNKTPIQASYLIINNGQTGWNCLCCTLVQF